MNTTPLQNKWTEWLAASEDLLRSLHEQTAAVTLRDIERVERIQPDLERKTSVIAALDREALDIARRLAGELNTQPNLRSLLSALDKTEAQLLQAAANRVTIAAHKVQSVLEKNRKLIECECVYIDGTLTFLAKQVVGRRGPYGNRSTRNAVLVDAAA